MDIQRIKELREEICNLENTKTKLQVLQQMREKDQPIKIHISDFYNYRVEGSAIDFDAFLHDRLMSIQVRLLEIAKEE